MDYRPKKVPEHRSIADMLLPLSSEQQQADLELFRVRYEREHGPTDLTRRYTSTWPTALQQSLFAHEPQAWFDGLPPFAKAFLVEQVRSHVDQGLLQPTDMNNIRLTSIRVGTDANDCIDRYWLEQFLGRAIRAPEDIIPGHSVAALR